MRQHRTERFAVNITTSLGCALLAYKLGREMIWSHTAHLYMDSFQRARRSRIDAPVKPLAIQTLEERH